MTDSSGKPLVAAENVAAVPDSLREVLRLLGEKPAFRTNGLSRGGLG
ncbi:hypothetical protein [Saccharothrix deserti]|nr:hypothetical protein [Saccharothrix deserti]